MEAVLVDEDDDGVEGEGGGHSEEEDQSQGLNGKHKFRDSRREIDATSQTRNNQSKIKFKLSMESVWPSSTCAASDFHPSFINLNEDYVACR